MDRATYASCARGCDPDIFIAFGMRAANIPRQCADASPPYEEPPRPSAPAGQLTPETND